MVQELARSPRVGQDARTTALQTDLPSPTIPSDPFPASAPVANPVFFRTYSRRVGNQRESWQQVCDRVTAGLATLGKFTPAETALIQRMQQSLKALPAGRWLWVGGTAWMEKPENFSGAYNCTSTNVVDWRAFGLMMDLAMMGCGTGAVLEPKYISQLPAIRNRLVVTVQGEIGSTPAPQRREQTEIQIHGNQVRMMVGDSRQGWVTSYQTLLELSTDERFTGDVHVIVDVSDVRSAGEPLKGFGGVANPVKLSGLYNRCAAILNKAVGRQLTSVECCLLIDEAAVTIVAGNIRRSAGMRQFDSHDQLGATAKDNLWQQDADGNWRIDPERDALRMANHTRVFHHQPTEQECIDAVRKQFYSGEGAIQYAPEAIARANADLLTTPDQKAAFLAAYLQGQARDWLRQNYPAMDGRELEHRLQRYGL
ncbi:MAG: ribonucleoside-triphosphate reductase, adenosylcobalamin-dependent, partial [Cyanobacteria bacterium]|nr:ribonucleoside-triphosphate reductase, adenosylcobalamin-dependent [Cyanobacteriota bacterium]MDW8201071.1 ribonucleoside-triphosphate reductase, adenosylcobalamin-dependent [Cyanobacteriota bacterium SKYGB_h_bin112]